MTNDYILYVTLKSAIIFMRLAPVNAWLFLARLAGRIYYYFAGKKNRRAYANLKIALGSIKDARRKRIIKDMYVCFAQNLVEAMSLKFMDENYIRQHVRINDIRLIEEAKKAGSSIIFLGSHAGSWELSNAACAALFPKGSYAMLAQPQSKHKKLDSYLNRLREEKGVGVIRVDQLKDLIRHLSSGNVLGTIADHGGQDGIPVEFFGKLAMTPVGGVRLAKKAKARIILAFMRRTKGPYHELLLRQYSLVSTGNEADDMKTNLLNINRIFQEWITQYPQEYLWFYKRWKHSPQKDILILSDGKIGHLKQSLACVDVFKDMGFVVKSRVVEVDFKGGIHARVFAILSFILGPRLLRSVLRVFIKNEIVGKLTGSAYDIVISAGSSLAPVNSAVSFDNNAVSVAIMKPGIEPLSRFNLVIMPTHDRPPERKNVMHLVGSLNAVSSGKIKEDFDKLVSWKPELREYEKANVPKIGLLLGGDSKNYTITKEMSDFLCLQIKRFLDETNGMVFITTSRRTPDTVVKVFESYFKNELCCRLFIVASEFNPEGTVGGIFHLSDYIIVSGESISMVSEAAASGKYTLAFEPHCQVPDNKVQRFLQAMSENGSIYFVKLNEIYNKLLFISRSKPEIKPLDTRRAVLEGFKKILYP